jgi:hypothetical protein
MTQCPVWIKIWTSLRNKILSIKRSTRLYITVIFWNWKVMEQQVRHRAAVSLTCAGWNVASDRQCYSTQSNFLPPPHSLLCRCVSWSRWRGMGVSAQYGWIIVHASLCVCLLPFSWGRMSVCVWRYQPSGLTPRKWEGKGRARVCLAPHTSAKECCCIEQLWSVQQLSL